MKREFKNRNYLLKNICNHSRKDQNNKKLEINKKLRSEENSNKKNQVILFKIKNHAVEVKENYEIKFLFNF